MKDQEQQNHLDCLEKKLGGFLVSLCEDEVTVENLKKGLLHNVMHTRSHQYGVEVDGALRAAKCLYSML